MLPNPMNLYHDPKLSSCEIAPPKLRRVWEVQTPSSLRETHRLRWGASPPTSSDGFPGGKGPLAHRTSSPAVLQVKVKIKIEIIPPGSGPKHRLLKESESPDPPPGPPGGGNVGGEAPHIFEGFPGAGQTSKTHPNKSGQTAFRCPECCVGTGPQTL